MRWRRSGAQALDALPALHRRDHDVRHPGDLVGVVDEVRQGESRRLAVVGADERDAKAALRLVAREGSVAPAGSPRYLGHAVGIHSCEYPAWRRPTLPSRSNEEATWF